MDRRCTAKSSRKTMRCEHATERDGVFSGVALVCKRLTREAVPEIVDPVVRDGPRVTGHETQWMAPGVCWGRVGKLWFAASYILLVVGTEVAKVASVPGDIE